jgi:SSS family solute:Na+ symporter
LNPLYIYLAVGIWAFFGLGIAYLARKRMGKGIPEFFVSSRKVGGFISGMTYSATTYSAFMMVGLVGLTYSSGVVALGFELTYLMFTLLLLCVFAPRFWAAANRYDYITPSDLLSHRYGDRRVGTAATILALVMLVPYASIQLMGSGYLFNGLTGGRVPFMTGVLIMAAFSGVTAFWAGFRSVSWTDAFQAMTMIITSVILLLYIFYHFFGSPLQFLSTVQSQTPQLLKVSWSFNMFVGLSLPWAFFALSNPQVSQRMFVSENVRSLKRMITYFAIFGLLYTVITTLTGLSAANIVPGLATADEAMPVLLTKVPTVMALIVFVGIFAAATSTLGSIVLTLSSMGVLNVAESVSPGMSEDSKLLIGKLVIVFLLAICILFASLKLDLIAILSSMASGGLLVAVPAFIGAFFWSRGTAQGAIWSIVVGGVLTAAMYISGYYPLGIWPPVWGIAASTLIFVMLSILTKTPEVADEFLEQVNSDLEEHSF